MENNQLLGHSARTFHCWIMASIIHRSRMYEMEMRSFLVNSESFHYLLNIWNVVNSVHPYIFKFALLQGLSG